MSEKSEKLVASGEKLFAKGSFHKALKAFREASELDPDDIFAWNNQGVALEEFGRIDDAIKCYQRATKIDTGFGLAWNNMGFAHAQLGDFKEAIKCYKRALKIDPGDQLAKERLKQAVKLIGFTGGEDE
jgi:superkiller protein 3